MFEECKRVGDFTLSSGRKSDVFYDFHLLSPREAREYTLKLLARVDRMTDLLLKEVQYVAVPETGGIIPGFIIAEALSVPLVIVTKDGKAKGNAEVFRGRYLIVDDVITTYRAINRVRGALGYDNCIGAIAYIFRGDKQDEKLPTFFLAHKEVEV